MCIRDRRHASRRRRPGRRRRRRQRRMGAGGIRECTCRPRPGLRDRGTARRRGPTGSVSFPSATRRTPRTRPGRRRTGAGAKRATTRARAAGASRARDIDARRRVPRARRVSGRLVETPRRERSGSGETPRPATCRKSFQTSRLRTPWSEGLASDDSGHSVCHTAVGSVGSTRRAKSTCLLYTSPSPRDATLSRMPSSA